MSEEKKRLCFDVVNELWGFSEVPENIRTLIESCPVKFMVAIVKTYADHKANCISDTNKQSLPVNSDNVIALLDDLLNSRQEIISSPIRFNGVSTEDIKRIFAKHGIEYKQLF